MDANISTEPDFDAVLRLLEIQSTFDHVQDFVRQRISEHSAGSWKDLIQNRIQPALNNGELKVQDLLNLLSEAEEHGDQHVMLYRLDHDASFGDLFDGGLARIVKMQNDWPEVDARTFVKLPENPTISEIRQDKLLKEKTIVVKIVEARTFRRRIGAKEEGNQYVVRYNQEDYRAVNVIRIRESGLAEVRIFRDKENDDYGAHALSALQRISALVPLQNWSQLTLHKFRNNLLNSSIRKQVRSKFFLRSTLQRDADGNRLQASSGIVNGDMYEAKGIVGSVDLFGEPKFSSRCDRASVMVLPNTNRGRSLSVTLHGDRNGHPNEFSLGAKLTKSEYEHVLSSILEFNK